MGRKKWAKKKRIKKRGGLGCSAFLFLTMKPEGRSNKNVTGRMAEMKDVIKEKLEQFVNNRKVTIKSLRIR